jgi:hypothetical protein
VKVKEGRPVRFDVWVAGEPAPAIEWFKDDVKLTTDDTISINVYAKNSSVYSLKNAVLSIPKVLYKKNYHQRDRVMAFLCLTLRIKNQC